MGLEARVLSPSSGSISALRPLYLRSIDAGLNDVITFLGKWRGVNAQCAPGAPQTASFRRFLPTCTVSSNPQAPSIRSGLWNPVSDPSVGCCS